ncbi:MAG: NADH-quinone oxidoreductase subunit C [Chloroflexota bacterium]|nr:NADH-quinone oxidoreductase subunit C [Chloroflexota bacterium]
MTSHSKSSSEHEVQTSPVSEALDQKSSNLQKNLKLAFAEFSEVDVSTSLDMVVLRVQSAKLSDVCEILKGNEKFSFNYLSCITAIDYEEQEEMFEVVYHLVSIEYHHKLAVKVSLPSSNPIVPSVFNIWKSADWFERESHDLFGIKFKGRENLQPLLLYEGFEGYPGRKSFPFHEYQEW